MSRETPAGKSKRRSPMGVGRSLRIADINAGDDPPPNGRSPAAISYSTMPSEKMSVRGSSGSPSICSGDMYGIVPTIMPAFVRGATVSLSSRRPGSADRARPKSSTFTRPSSETMTLAGLRSRCVRCLRCAAASASARAIAMSKNCASDTPPRGIIWSSVRPSTSSIVRNRTPSASSVEKIVTMCGWLRAATACASRSKRARASGSCAIWTGSALIATSRPSRVSRAR